jgi:hypothetical protein
MSDRLARVRLIAHAGQHHQPVDANFLRRRGKAARQCGRVFRDAGKDRNAAGDVLDDGAEQA